MDLVVHFEFQGQIIFRYTPDTESWTLEDIKDGFWVTNGIVLCRPSQGSKWIPPSCIKLVELRTE